MSKIILILCFLDLILTSIGLWLALKILKFEGINIRHILMVSIISRSIVVIPVLVLNPMYFRVANLLGISIMLSSMAAGILCMMLLIHHLFNVNFKKAILATVISSIIGILLVLIVTPAIFLAMSILLGSPTPFVIFTSGSMTHSDDVWGLWLEEHNISKAEISKFPFQGGINRGEILLVMSPGSIQLGDVIMYDRNKAHRGDPIVSRVVGIVHVDEWRIGRVEGTLDCLSEGNFHGGYITYIKNCIKGMGKCPYQQFPSTGTFRFYITKGDGNWESDQCGASLPPVTGQQIRGKVLDL